MLLAGADRTREILEDELPELVLEGVIAGGDATVGSARARGSLFRDGPIEQELPTSIDEEPRPRAAQDDVVSIAFNGTNPRAINYAGERSARLIVEIDAETRRVIRQMVSDAFEEGFVPDASGRFQQIRGIPPRQLARRIRGQVGLTTRQYQAVLNLRRELEERAEGIVRRAGLDLPIPPGGFSRSQIERISSRYSERLHRGRALNIARTETIDSANEGQRQLWLQAREDGLLTGAEKREWIVTPDDRLCPVCRRMAGQVRGLEERFDAGRFGRVMGPTAHPQCRCATGLVRDAAGASAPPDAPQDRVDSGTVNIGSATRDVLARAARGEKIADDAIYNSLSTADQQRILQFIARGERNLEEYRRLLLSAADELGFVEGSFSNLRARTLVQGPLKKPDRAAAKIVSDYGGKIDDLSDVLRATFVVEDPADAERVLELLQRLDHPLKAKNRMLNPLPGGYRDMIFKLELPDGMLAEVQVNTVPMLQAKNARGHALYEEIRKLPKGSPEYERLMDEMEDLYRAAWTDVCRQAPDFGDCGDFVGNIQWAGNSVRVGTDPDAWEPPGGWTSALPDDVAAAIRREELERAASWTSDGRFVGGYTSNERKWVRPPDKALEQFKGGRMIHNHPSGTPFSEPDIKFAAAYDIADMRVTGFLDELGEVDYQITGIRDALRRAIDLEYIDETLSEADQLWKLGQLLETDYQLTMAAVRQDVIKVFPGVLGGGAGGMTGQQLGAPPEAFVRFVHSLHRHAALKGLARRWGFKYEAHGEIRWFIDRFGISMDSDTLDGVVKRLFPELADLVDAALGIG